jgi:hypothetical protein
MHGCLTSLPCLSVLPQTKMTELKEQMTSINTLNLEWVRAAPVVHKAMSAFQSNLLEKLNLLNSRVKYLQGEEAPPHHSRCL